MQRRNASTVVILGTGGTIAGTSAHAQDNLGYRAAQLGVAELASAVPMPGGVRIELEQVVQIDSKDMGFAVWLALAKRVAHHLARPQVCGVVITHGTDTLEETAYFLQRVLAPAKPVAVTGAMRPATSRQADGPQNLCDAVAVASAAGTHGVVAVFAGAVHAAREVRKIHPYRIDAFGSGDSGPLAWIEEGELRPLRTWPTDRPLGLELLPADIALWPAVDIVTSMSGARPAAVAALCASGVRGLVVAATGNGTVHAELEAALLQAQAQGIAVLRSTRCLDGRIACPKSDAAAALPSAGDLTPVKARIELMLSLMCPVAR